MLALTNLAVPYFELGLYSHVHRLENEVVETARRIGAKVILAHALNTFIVAEISLGKLDLARLHLHELKELTLDRGDSYMDSILASTWGDLTFAEGDFKNAIRHFKSALKTTRETKSGVEIVYLTELGKIHLASGDKLAALKATTQATDLHRAQSYARPDAIASQAVWWRHAQALNANQKAKEAREALDRAYDFLIEGIQSVRDIGLRRNYLNKVTANRELLQFWLKDGTRRKLSKERLFSYLHIESNTREPFKRLADTSLRLNALRTIPAIQTFLVEEATELSGGQRVMLVLEKDGKLEAADAILPVGEDAKTALPSIRKYLNQVRLTRTVELILPRRSGLNRIIAPLIAQNQILGYLYADMDSTYGRFDETDRDMLGMLANQAAVALDNAGLVTGLEQKVQERTAQLQERINELQIINSIQQGLAAELNFKSSVDLVGSQLSNVLNTQDIIIGWYDEKARLMHYLYAFEHGSPLKLPSMPPTPGGIFETMRKTRKPIVFSNIADSSKLNAPVAAGTDQGLSFAAIPIINNDRVLGLISVENFERENAYGEAELRLLTTIAASLGAALENARLFDETQRLLKESNTLADVGRVISSSLDSKSVLGSIASHAKILLDGNLSALFVPENDGELFRAITAVGENADELRNETILIGEGILGSVAKNRIAEIVNDTGGDARTIVVSGTQSQPDEHLLAVPLLAEDELKGLMAVWRVGKDREFTENELTFLSNLARQAVIALKNAHLFTEVQEARAAAEQASRAKSAFLANMSHELRTPLNAIINFTQLVIMGSMGPINEEQEEALGHSFSSSKHLLQLINDVLDISKIQAGKLTMFVEEGVDLRVEIDEALMMVEPMLQKHAELYGYDVQLVRDIDADLPAVTCDRRRVKQVLLNLLSNAVKFTEKGTITLSVKRHEAHITFAVMDTGPGIAEDLQKQIFEPFVQTLDGMKQADGTGLGLPISYSLIEAHGGKLWLESELGQGSAFFFTLPIPQKPR